MPFEQLHPGVIIYCKTKKLMIHFLTYSFRCQLMKQHVSCIVLEKNDAYKYDVSYCHSCINTVWFNSEKFCNYRVFTIKYEMMEIPCFVFQYTLTMAIS